MRKPRARAISQISAHRYSVLRSDGIVIARSEATRRSRSRGELYVPLDCYASLAMTTPVPSKWYRGKACYWPPACTFFT
jgi:hypothetical protein